MAVGRCILEDFAWSFEAELDGESGASLEGCADSGREYIAGMRWAERRGWRYDEAI